MKHTINALITTVALTLAASAAPTLVIDTTISEQNAKGDKTVLATPRVVVESGKQAIIQHAKLAYAITPTLLDNGTVDIRIVITERNGKKADKLATPRAVVELGKDAVIQIEQLALTATPSLAK